MTTSRVLIQFLMTVTSVWAADGAFQLPFTYSNGTFQTQLELGSNHIPVNLVFDTGSSDFWVPNGLFNGVNDSDTFQLNETAGSFQMAYGTGDVRPMGKWGDDELYLENGLPLGRCSVAITNNTDVNYGILGLGFPSLESTNIVSSGPNRSRYEYGQFTEKIVEEGIISSRLFGVDLSITNGNGSMVFGGVDKSRIPANGQMYKFPMVSAFFTLDGQRHPSIAITLNSMSLMNADSKEEQEIFDGFFPALLDTGTTYAMFPSAVFNKLVQALGLRQNPDLGLYTTKCETLESQSLQLSFQGVKYDFPMSALFAKSEKGDVCAFMANGSPLQFSIILGDAFLEQLYVIVDMDNQQIGVVPSNPVYAAADIVAITNISSIADDPPLTQTYDVAHMMYTIASASASASASPTTLATATAVATTASASTSTSTSKRHGSASVAVSSGAAPANTPSARVVPLLLPLAALLV